MQIDELKKSQQQLQVQLGDLQGSKLVADTLVAELRCQLEESTECTSQQTTSQIEVKLSFWISNINFNSCKSDIDNY